MDTIQYCDPKSLTQHPKNETIFGDPRKSPAYAEVLESIRTRGIQEPIIIKEGGTVLAGHMRLACALELELQTVPVRTRPAFENERDEVTYLIDSNTKRRQLTPREAIAVYEILKTLSAKEGGLKKSIGRPKPDPAKQPTTEPPAPSTRDRTGMGEGKLRALQRMLASPDVSDEDKEKLKSGELSPFAVEKLVKEAKKPKAPPSKADAVRAAVEAGGPVDLEEEAPPAEVEGEVTVDVEETPNTPFRGSKIVEVGDIATASENVSEEVQKVHKEFESGVPLATAPIPRIEVEPEESEPAHREVKTPEAALSGKAFLKRALLALKEGMVAIKAEPDRELTHKVLDAIVLKANELRDSIPRPIALPIPKDTNPVEGEPFTDAENGGEAVPVPEKARITIAPQLVKAEETALLD